MRSIKINQSPPQLLPPQQRELAKAETVEASFLPELQTKEDVNSASIPYSLWTGGGFNYLRYVQDGTGSIRSSTYATFGPTAMLAGKLKITEKMAASAEYHYIPGQIQTEAETRISSNSYIWSSTSGELAYAVSPQASPHTWSVLLGVQRHQFPFLYETNSGTIFLADTTSTNMNIGAKAEFYRFDVWTYEVYMRYQHPVSSTASQGTIHITPQLSFDGSLGLSRRLGENLRLGAYWFGQSHLFKYLHTANDASDDSTGTQTMFNSNLQLRLGWVVQ